MISSVTDTWAGLTQIGVTVKGSRQEVDFDHVLVEAVSVDPEEESEQGTKIVDAKKTLTQIFEAAADKYGVPLKLLKAMAKQESDFNTNCVSYAGAQGIMQLMPATARSLGVKDAFDPEQNIMGGAKYISQKLKMYNGDVTLALAAYNAGSGNVSKYGGVPPFTETKNYIRKVLGYMEQDVKIPDKTVKVSGMSVSERVSVKRKAAMTGQELKAADASEAEDFTHQLLDVSEQSVSAAMEDSLRLFYEEKNKLSVMTMMEKLLV